MTLEVGKLVRPITTDHPFQNEWPSTPGKIVEITDGYVEVEWKRDDGSTQCLAFDRDELELVKESTDAT